MDLDEEHEASGHLLSRRQSGSVHAHGSGGVALGEVNEKQVPRQEYKELIILLAHIAGWYVFSVSLSLYNKWMFGQSKLNLPFPVLITSFHQLLLSIASFLMIRFTSLRHHQHEEPVAVVKSGGEYWDRYPRTVLPCAVSSAGDIGFGNMSFRFINLSTYTMVKSSSIAFVLLFSIMAKIEKFTYNLLGIVLLMTAGVVLMSDRDDTRENKSFVLGFVLVLLSACMSGLRWVLTQILLRLNEGEQQHKEQSVELHETITKRKAKRHPVFTIQQLAPSMFVILFFAGLVLEGGGEFARAAIWKEKGILQGVILLVFPGVLVMFMTIFEFGILQRSRVLTLSIAGILKELLTILISFLVFDDSLTWINLAGLVVTLADIGWYNVYRYRQNQQEQQEQQMQAEQALEVELEERQ
jgi:solute carrier family 35 protein C2